MPSRLIRITTAENPDRYDCLGVVTLGRDSRSTVPVDDPQVSRRHALIQEVGRERFYLLDLGSRNGCFVNDRRVTAPRRLTDGDVVGVGETELIFRQTLPAGGVSLTDVGRTETMIRSDIRSVAILVADIRGYTPFSGTVEVHELANLTAGVPDRARAPRAHPRPGRAAARRRAAVRGSRGPARRCGYLKLS